MSSSSRGQLLRDVTRLSTDIIGLHSRATAGQAKLAAETKTKAELLDKIAAAEEELAALEAQRKFDSENDTELISLQRAGGEMALRRQELIRETKHARLERDRARDDELRAYYERLGAALEVARVASYVGEGAADSRAASSLSLKADTSHWRPADAWLLKECDGLWKRVSEKGVITRDLVHAALASNNLALQLPSTAAAPLARAPSTKSSTPYLSGSGQPPANDADPAGSASRTSSAAVAGVTAAASMYSTLGTRHIAVDTAKALDGLAQLDTALRAFEAKCTAAERGQPASTLTATVTLIKQNVAVQRTLLLAVNRTVGGISAGADSVSEDADREDETGKAPSSNDRGRPPISIQKTTSMETAGTDGTSRGPAPLMSNSGSPRPYVL
jgi:hypothetical protein